MDEQDQIQCAHESCRCIVDTSIDELPDIDLDDSSLYCSAGCADGRGCDHSGCECAGSAASTTAG